jgi:hypothetical protein
MKDGKLENRSKSWGELMLTEDKLYTAVCESYLKPLVVIDGKELPGFPSDAISSNTATR